MVFLGGRREKGRGVGVCLYPRVPRAETIHPAGSLTITDGVEIIAGCNANHYVADPMAERVGAVMRKVGNCPPVEANSACNRERCVGSSMFSPEAWAQIARSLGLSGRELQIVRGTFDDKTEFDLAAEFHISPSTIHTHVERLHHKLVITNRAQLLLRVTQEFIALTATPGNDLPPICADRATHHCSWRP